MGNEVLQSLVGAGIAEPPMHRLHRFPLAVVEQALHVPTGVRPVCSATETASELIQEGAKPLQQRTRRWIGHASEHKKFRRSVQVKLTK
jgi:hypothetical protein